MNNQMRFVRFCLVKGTSCKEETGLKTSRMRTDFRLQASCGCQNINQQQNYFMCFELQLFRAQPAVLVRFLPSKNEKSLAHDMTETCATHTGPQLFSREVKNTAKHNTAAITTMFSKLQTFFCYLFSQKQTRPQIDCRNAVSVFSILFLSKGLVKLLPLWSIPVSDSERFRFRFFIHKFYKESVSKSCKHINISKRQTLTYISQHCTGLDTRDADFPGLSEYVTTGQGCSVTANVRWLQRPTQAAAKQTGPPAPSTSFTHAIDHDFLLSPSPIAVL